MTTYARREFSHRRIEYGVESGSNNGVFTRVYAMAYAEYCDRTGYDRERMEYDDWATVEARDDEIVIAFTLDEPPPDAERWEKAKRLVVDLIGDVAIGRTVTADSFDNLRRVIYAEPEPAKG